MIDDRFPTAVAFAAVLALLALAGYIHMQKERIPSPPANVTIAPDAAAVADADRAAEIRRVMTRAESGDPEIRSHGGTLIEVLQFCDLPFSDRAFLRQYDSTVKGVKACDDEVPRGD